MTNVGRFRVRARPDPTVVHRLVSVFPGEPRVDGEKSETFPSGSPQGGACMLRPMGGMGIGGTV